MARFAAPTAQPPAADNASSEGRADPHGLQHVRAAPPFDHASYAANVPVDCVAQSLARHTDSNGNGTGTGRRGTGWQLLGAGTVTVTTGAGQSETYQGTTLPQGYAVVGELLSVQATAPILVTW